MANLVVHFEIHASEPQKVIDFYTELLGWTSRSSWGDVAVLVDRDRRRRHRQRGRVVRARHQRRPERAARARSPRSARPSSGLQLRRGRGRRGCPHGARHRARRHRGAPRDGHAGRRPGRLSARPGQQRVRDDLGGHVRRYDRHGGRQRRTDPGVRGSTEDHDTTCQPSGGRWP